ncbi:otogelin-like protein [Terrapene carolina triunguis]|uniref:otogelin-like protein n=1 Tax=Terrapene triunguis TaxID=2587831 RepID=UPI000E777057|nr:otogelin-like protein [Terrapene carolina triunguis]
MNIVGKLNLMIPWSIFLVHSLLFSLQGSYCEFSLLRRTPRNQFNATRQKRDLLAAETGADSAGSHLHGDLTQGQSPSGVSCPQECLNGAVCTEAGVCDCQMFQAHGKRCQIVPNDGKDRDGICKSWGQYHFETFDGIYYYFPGNCSYIFAKDCSAPEPQYTVWVHNSPQCDGSVYSCLRSISLFFSSQDEIVVVGHEVRKEGIRLTLPQTIGNVFIERLADYILVKTTFGFSLAWDGSSGIYIKLTEEHKGKPCGLCGNYNGNKSDDLIIQNIGEYTEDIAVFANSWSIQTPDDAICVTTASDFSSPCSTDTESSEAIFFKCQILLQFPFLSCHENVDPYSYISSCMNDLCRVDDDETYCRAVTEYARACSHAGYPVRDWREDFLACSEKCEDSFVHRDCISCCPPTCTFEKDCLGSNLHCLDGCYCPDGLVMDNGTCISVSNCPCIYHGKAFSAGSKIEQECSQCTCTGGIWNCTEHDCPAECTIVGDSHFTTFDGRHYTFLGICQYILVKGTGKDKFTITLQKAPCDQNLDCGCIQSVTLVLEDDMSKQVTLTRDGEVQTGPSQGFNFNGDIEIRNLSSLFVQLKTRFGLKIQFAKDGQRLYIQVNTSWKRRTLGLCGTFNGNLRDDFLSPAGMIEGTPQLHANAWKVSSACFAPVNIPVVDPCNINQQNVGYASHCDIINQELFAPCHPYISPGLYYQLCRFDACKCGSSCLCNALAHYAYICSKHGIAIDFRSQVSYCALVCRSGMLYHRCSSFCKHSCSSLSAPHVCNDDCAEGCNCPDGKYFEESINFCVPISSCRCYYKGRSFQPAEILPTPSGSCQCLNGTMKCTETATTAVHTCPEGKIYYDCRYPVPGLPAAGVNCEISCANLAMNFTCVPSPPCASGCICPPGMAEHKGNCYVPDSCPCTWKDWEYLSGEVIATPCYTCVCRRGIFTCTSYPCPAVCTVYGDRHYYTFDGLEYDYVSDCQAYLVKSTDNSNVSVIAQNKKCFDNDIVCSKSVLISVGDTEIYFSEPSDKQRTARGREKNPTYQLWKAGYYTVVHFPEQEITILWDKKTTIHVKVGPRWKGKLAGLCGNFDKYTSNDLTTSNNMEVRNAQVFGESWAIGQCKSPNETIKPCEVHQSKFPYAKRECSILYSDVFAPCRNVIDVTSFVKNCHTDTCNCNLGGDCECLCTSIAAYAYKCCQQGAAIHWRSPSVCPYNCEYYNQGLGEGPYILASYGQNDTVIGANITSRKLFPLPRISTYENVGFSFMITPGLFKDKDLSLSLVSLESAERPNYFLYVHDNETVTLEQWAANSSFRRRATFFHHQGLWIPDYSAFELHNKKGFFIILTASGIKVSKYDDSEEFKRTSSFSIEDLHASVPYRRMCEWRYEPCASPCFKTCSDPEGVECKFLPPVEGCLPYCPKNMILDEVTLKCVYPEDCIPVTPTELAAGTKTQRTRPTALISPTIVTTERFPQLPPIFVTAEAEAEPSHTIVTTKITTKIDATLRGANTTAETLSDFHSLASPHTTTYLTYSLPVSSTMQSSKVTHSTASLSVLPKPVSSTDFPATLQTSAATLKTSPTVSPTVFITSPITMAVPSTPSFTLLTASPVPRHSTLPMPTSLVVTPFSLETGTASSSTALASLSPGPAFVTTEVPTRIWGTRRPSTSHSQLPQTSTEFPSSASLTGRTSFSSPTFFTSSQLILTASTSPLSTMTERTRSTMVQPIVHPASVYAPTSTVFQTPMATSRFTSFETSPPQLITASYLVATPPTSQTTSSSLRTTSSLTRTSLPTFLSSMDISVTPSKHIVPLSTDTVSTIPPIITETSSPVASQIPTTMRTTWSSLSPLVTHTMSTLMPPPITSPKPKATREVTVVSKSLFLEPSTTSVSLLATPQISEVSVTSTISTESKYALHTDAFPISTISKRLTASISSTAFPFSTPVFPINATLATYQMARTTSKITEYPISPHSEFKTSSVVRSTDTSLTSRELSGAILSFTMLLSSARPSVSQTSAMTSHTTSSSVIPTVNRTSALISNVTLTQSPIVSMGTQETSKSPHTELATSLSGIATLTLDTNIYISPSAVPKTSFALPHLLTSKTPKVTLESYSSIFTTTSSPSSETSHVSTVSLGTNISSLSPSTESETRTFVPTEIVTHSTVPSAALTMSTALSTTSLVPTYVTMKTSVSPSITLLVTPAATIAPSVTAKTTESSVTHIELYTASSSVPIPATSKTPMYPSPKTLLTSAHSPVSLSTKEMIKTIVMKTTGAMTAFSELKITPSATSELKYATSIGRTADTRESSQTSHVQRNITKTKSTTTEKSSLLHSTFSSVQTTSLPSQSSITSGKSVSISEVTDVPLSDWSRIPPQRTIKPYYNLTEPEQVGIGESQSTTVTASSHFSYAKVLSSTTEPVETQASLTDTDMMMTVTAGHASYGTMIHTLMSSSSDCMPRYIEPVDRCSQYVCINMGWMLYNVSRNCHKNVEKPDCGFRGMPVQVNSDSCCPEWECPCQCSVLSELSIITFDGNNIALYNMASYILVKLPGEIIVAHIEKCPTNRSANSIRKLVSPGGTSGLCFKKLNVTTPTNKVLINRLARKVVVDSVIQPLPFSKHGLCIQDTGAMYVINTPAGISIKWAHVTGIIDIQYGLHSNTSTKTEGLCGVCNGDPVDDLKMQNRTIITNMEEIEAFIKSWEIEKSVDVTTRRPVRNCTEDNCTYCMELLNRRVFVPCHKKHQIYIPSSSHHVCCGTCQNVSCTFYTENGTLSVHEEGSTWVSNCTKYECAKTAVGAMILGSSVVCPPFNETECTKNGGTVQTYNDGCCKTCSGLGVLPFAISPVVSTDSINCEPGRKEERICQKVTVRTTIRKSDCISQRPINVASCEGKCPSATIFNVNIDSHLRFCKCCRENGVQNLTVPLYCSGNGTEVMYVIQEPTDCSCQWN